MSYVFKITDVIVFDVHTVVQPLLDPALVTQPFQFLLDPAAYAKQHSLTARFPAGGLTLEPISTEGSSMNHFWRACASIAHGATPDMWKLQAPFIASAPLNRIAFTPGVKNVKASVSESIYLSTIGWSTKLHIRLVGAMSPTDLQNALRQLCSGKSFMIGGASDKTLSEVFIATAGAIKKELYRNPGASYDRVMTPRHIVVSIAKYEGEEASFQAGGMTDADRAEIHSIMLARSITVQDLANYETRQSFLKTQYTPYDFAITYFEKGTFLWMQLPRRKGKRTSLWCLPSNLASCSLFLLGLGGFWKSTQLQGSTTGPIKELRDAIRFTVSQMPLAYTNKFCRGFVANHSDLNKIL